MENSIIIEENGRNSTRTSSEGVLPNWNNIRQQDSASCNSTADQMSTIRNSQRTRWTRAMNIEVMECYYLASPVDVNGRPVRGYRKRMFDIWKSREGNLGVTEQRICDQVRTIKKNGLLSPVEMESIRRRVAGEPCVVSGEHSSSASIEDRLVSDSNDCESMRVNRALMVGASVPEQYMETVREVVKIFEELGKSTSNYKFDFKRVDSRRLAEETSIGNEVLKYIRTKNISDTNKLLLSISVLIARRLGLRNQFERDGAKKRNWKEPAWKRRLDNDVLKLRGNISVLDQKLKGTLKKEWKYKELERKFGIKKKGLRVVLEELKQRLTAKKTKIKRYEERIKRYQQNRLFRIDQRRFYQQVNGDLRDEKIVPNADESVRFWEGIWNNRSVHNKEADWLCELKGKYEYLRQQNLEIDVNKLRKRSKRMANWKTPGSDGVQGYWVKYLSNCHERIAAQLNELVNGSTEIPQWLTYGRTVLCLKDPKRGNVADNYRPISCLPIMWKLLTGIISDSLYEFLEENEVLPLEQKGCKRGSRGTKDQLLIDKMVLRDSKRRRTNLTMAWIDYRKAYDMVPHSWIGECLELFGCAANVCSFIGSSMERWRCELSASGKVLGDIRIRRGIFQGDSLSLLLFVICMIPLTLVLREMKAGYEFKDGGGKINHLLYMDDLKLFGKSKAQIVSLVDTVQLVSRDIGMEFGIKKCGVLCLKRGVVTECEDITLPDGKIMQSIDAEGYKYLGILEMNSIMTTQMKEKVRREYLRRVRVVLKSKLNGRNKIMGINTWAIALLRYGSGILEWRKEELQNLDRKTRKLMTTYGALHPKSDVDRLYLPRKRGGRGLLGCERSVRTEANSLGWYVKKSVEPLLKEVGRSNILDVDGSIPKESYKQKLRTTTEERWKDKRMYGQYYREMSEVADLSKTWMWLRKSDLKPETEALICAAQEQALRTNYIKCNIDGSIESPLCRLCKEKGESVYHIVSECKVLAQREYKRRHDKIAQFIHWELCGKYKLERSRNWYEHKPEGVVESDDVKILWDFMIQCDRMVEHRKPDIVVVEKSEKSCLIIDVAVPGDTRVEGKEDEKIEKYQELRQEIVKLWKMKKVEIVPVVIGALGAVSVGISGWLKKLDINIKVEHIQKTALLGTARILRRHLNM